MVVPIELTPQYVATTALYYSDKDLANVAIYMRGVIRSSSRYHEYMEALTRYASVNDCYVTDSFCAENIVGITFFLNTIEKPLAEMENKDRPTTLYEILWAYEHLSSRYGFDLPPINTTVVEMTAERSVVKSIDAYTKLSTENVHCDKRYD